MAAVVGVLAALAGGVYAVMQFTSHPAGAVHVLAQEAPLPSSSIATVDGAATAPVSASTAASVEIEVPSVVGKDVKVAAAVLSAAGLTVQTRVADAKATGVAPNAIVSQWPESGAIVEPGSNVVVTYEPAALASPSAPSATVVIDAGHQAKPDLALEPIGPGSATAKAKVAAGNTGVATGVPEYARDLEIAMRLRAALIAKGLRVVMVRTTNNVDIPNSERAKIGNDVKAALVVRIHCDWSTDSAAAGISTLYPAGNTWVAPIEARSKAAATAIEAAVAAAAHATARGIVPTSDMSGFNYSTHPTVLVQCGFMSNRAEDTALGQPAYQERLAQGIADGIVSFLGH